MGLKRNVSFSTLAVENNLQLSRLSHVHVYNAHSLCLGGLSVRAWVFDHASCANRTDPKVCRCVPRHGCANTTWPHSASSNRRIRTTQRHLRLVQHGLPARLLGVQRKVWPCS